MVEKKDKKKAVTYKMIAEALFENYESIYDIHLDTRNYKTYYQSDSYRELKLTKKGSDFFRDLPAGVQRTIAPEDRNYVLQMLEKDALVRGTGGEKYYQLVYRILNNGEKVYHQLRATRQPAEDGMHILMGIRNIDDLIRTQIAHEKTVESLRQKDLNHLEAILGSAAACLEANLTANLVLELSIGHRGEEHRQLSALPAISEIPEYDALQTWIYDHILAENKEGYRRISSREYLMDCHNRGDRRASVSFSLYAKNGSMLPCRAIFYLYQEKATEDLHVFCVIYDLTEQQRKEKELQELEEKLSMTRIRNSTSQMQPHFLYNALGSIQELILIDPQYASDLLEDFMIHMRSCVRAMSSDEPIRFSEELKNIKAYVNIEKMRLGNRLHMEYDIQKTDFSVLPLSIQPLVENAIRHGVHKLGKNGGTVTLRTRSEGGSWVVQVEDDGVGFDPGQVLRDIRAGKKDSTGLENIRFRLERVMGASMKIRSLPGSGTKVTVRIPKKRGSNESDYR